MRNVFDYNTNDDYLAHYGVLGMRWGVRRDPQKAYTKASAKAKSYQKKIIKYTDKANKNFSRGVARSGGLFKSKAVYQKVFARAGRQTRKALKYAKRGNKWIENMKKEFAKQSVVTIDQNILDLGQYYTNRLTAAADKKYLQSF